MCRDILQGPSVPLKLRGPDDLWPTYLSLHCLASSTTFSLLWDFGRQWSSCWACLCSPSIGSSHFQYGLVQLTLHLPLYPLIAHIHLPVKRLLLSDRVSWGCFIGEKVPSQANKQGVSPQLSPCPSQSFNKTFLELSKVSKWNGRGPLNVRSGWQTKENAWTFGCEIFLQFLMFNRSRLKVFYIKALLSIFTHTHTIPSGLNPPGVVEWALCY